MKTYRKKQTQKKKILFTTISRGFVTPVNRIPKILPSKNVNSFIGTN